MIAVDTNIVIRFLTQDDQQQFEKARAIFKAQEVFIADSVILETEWVLRYAYKFSPELICNALTNLFGLFNVYLLNPGKTAQAIAWHKQGLDFSDAMHLSQCQQYEKLYTFNKSFLLKSKGLTNCHVIFP